MNEIDKKTIALMCKNSYKFSTLKNQMTFENSRGLQCVIYEDAANKQICTTFRGSDENIDWIYNLMFFSYDMGEGSRVHWGHYVMFFSDGMGPKIVDAIRVLKEKRRNYRVVVSGHSLGGCLAQICAYELYRAKQIKGHVLIFGSSTIGNMKFQRYLRDNTSGYVCCNIESDCVPKLISVAFPNFYCRQILLPNIREQGCLSSHDIDYYLLLLSAIQ